MLCIDDLFKGCHFDREIIILCVRWYHRFKLSFRDLEGMMAELAERRVSSSRHRLRDLPTKLRMLGEWFGRALDD